MIKLGALIVEVIFRCKEVDAIKWSSTIRLLKLHIILLSFEYKHLFSISFAIFINRKMKVILYKLLPIIMLSLL